MPAHPSQCVRLDGRIARTHRASEPFRLDND
jgi:hypothetical protein